MIIFKVYYLKIKLLDLQLNDSNFRRQILIQFLVLFQYFTSEVKFKSSSQILNEEQQNWVKNSTKRVNDVIDY
jgi:THO complex subunit 1